MPMTYRVLSKEANKVKWRKETYLTCLFIFNCLKAVVFSGYLSVNLSVSLWMKLGSWQGIRHTPSLGSPFCCTRDQAEPVFYFSFCLGIDHAF